MNKKAQGGAWEVIRRIAFFMAVTLALIAFAAVFLPMIGVKVDYISPLI